jgi:hypothetical protein
LVIVDGRRQLESQAAVFRHCVLYIFGQFMCAAPGDVEGDAAGDGDVAALATTKPPMPAPAARLTAKKALITGRRNTASASPLGDATGSTTGGCEF